MKKIRPERHPPSLPGDPFAFYNLHHVTGGMIFAALYNKKGAKNYEVRWIFMAWPWLHVARLVQYSNIDGRVYLLLCLLSIHRRLD
ncbi:MAG: hypothetical protein IKX18_01035 [Muribaculaceae bacterium]|nr:hypothetical protein [Muribaculaceae bacterium]